MDETFYSERQLPTPVGEYHPDSAGALAALMRESADGPARLILGGGEHVETSAVGERSFEVIRTGGCDAIRDFRPESGTVRVEAGVSWGALRAYLAERDFALDGYGLYPAGATVGGLLARRQSTDHGFHDGDIRGGCIALSAVSPGSEDYRYLPAPRKATGPDLRHLYVGGEGGFGAILEATLVVRRRQPGWLWRLEAAGVDEAVAAFRTLQELDIRPSWARWARSEGVWEAAVFAPAAVLRDWDRRAKARFGEGLEAEVARAARARRGELEAAHPGARSGAAAERCVRVSLPLAEVAAGLEEAAAGPQAGLEDVVLVGGGVREVRAYLVAAEGGERAALEGVDGVMGRRRIVGARERIWPVWVQALKRELDPERVLAVGP